MKPADCKTARQAASAASAVYEARVVVVGVTGLVTSKLDDELYKLEHAYWQRAEAPTKPPKLRKGER